VQCTGKVRRKLSYTALYRTVLYCTVRWCGFNNPVSGGSGAEYRKPSKTSRSIGFATAVFEDFEWLAKPWGRGHRDRSRGHRDQPRSPRDRSRCARPQGFASHSKSSKTAFAKPLLREVFDGFLYSALHVPETWLLNPPHRTVTYSTIQYETVHYNLTYA